MIAALAVAACGLACGVGTLVLVLDSPGGSLAGGSTVGLIALAGVGWLAIAVGLGDVRRRPGNRLGVLLVAVGFAWFVAEWNNPGAGSPVVFTLGLVLGAACPPLATHAAFSYPSGRLGSTIEHVVVATAYIGSLFVLGLGPALVFEPAEQGCGQCATNLVAVGNDPAVVASLTRAGVRLGLVWALALGVLAMWRLLSTTPAARRVTAPVLVPTIAYLGAVAATYGHALDRGFLSNDAVDRRLWLVQAGALALLVVGVVAGWVNARRARTAVADMVVQLAAAPPPGGLRDALARTLGDPQLTIAYPLPDGRHVDADGVAIARGTAPGRATTALLDGGETIAFVFHRDDLLGDPRLVEEAASAARLAFANERLQAEARAELAELRTSRARLVAASDAERRRLERDLHDGAQQRLVGLTLAMRLMRTQLERDGSSALAAQIAAADAELRRAVDELRELASGIHPSVLTDYGLVPAIEALAERGKVTVRLSGVTDERFSSAAENAAYLLVAEAARLGPVTVTMRRRDTKLVVDVDATGEPPRLVDVEDRVGALEGSIAIEPTRHGVRIRAEIPCGVVIADDSMLVREGLARLLADAGCEVVATASDAPQLLRAVNAALPDVAIVDIKMPPTFTDEGISAASVIRRHHPSVGVLVLSQHLESEYAMRLLTEVPERAGYLLKDRLADVAVLVDALRRIGEGECVVDPTIVSRLVRRPRDPSPLDELSEREREVLGLMAEGRSNQAIAERLFVSSKTVEAHVRQILLKLHLPESPDDHRRVLAVLTYLRSAQ